MKTKADVVRGWLRKAASDMVTLEAALGAGAFDGACFHAQQGAEKYLKGFLAFHDRPFPFTHNLGDLTELCAGIDPLFRLSITHKFGRIESKLDVGESGEPTPHHRITWGSITSASKIAAKSG